jgi:hypothetical protein
MPRRISKENKFYNPSPTMTCSVCLAEIYEGYKERHELSNRHKFAQKVISTYFERFNQTIEQYVK